MSFVGDAVARDVILHVADAVAHAPLLLCLLVVVVSAAGSALPVSPIEPLVVLVALASPRGMLAPLVVLATAGHMAAKFLVFLGSRRAERALTARGREAVERATALLANRRLLRGLLLLASAATGLPPFYAVTIAAGALGLPLGEYLLLGTVGRGARFAAFALVPRLLAAALVVAMIEAPALATMRAGGVS